MRAKTNKVFTKTIQIQECFKYILGDYYTYLCYYGGRGGGKSESIAQMLVLRAANEPRLRILCMRETQNTIADSVKSILEKWIHALLLHDPILNVFEVRASTDKIRRSLPIASLGYMNRLKHLGHSFLIMFSFFI